MRAIALFAVLLAYAPLAEAAQTGTTGIKVLYTGAIKGELEPCGCSPKTQSGGLARLSGFVKARSGELGPYVLLDAGAQLADDSAQGRLKSEALIKAFDRIGYDAVALFGKDAPDVAKRFPKGFRGALVYKSANKKSITLKRAGVRINVGVDPKSSKRGFLNILLTDKQVNEAAKLQGWDIVISSSGEVMEEPVINGSAIVIAGYPKGQKLGVLDLKLGPSGNVISHNHRWQPLGSDVEEDGQVRLIIEEYEKKVAKLVDLAPRQMVKDPAYSGEASCAECHASYNEGWRMTRHANAFDTLVNAGRSKNPECVGCHTTGYGEEGGFFNEASTPGLKGVQCEVCHGPAKEHSSSFGPMAVVDESTCARCHTKERSPEFNYSTYVERIKHGGI